MQHPTDNLRADHRVTAQALRTLGALAEHVRAGGAFPAADAAQLLRYLREFLVGTHFRKEAEFVCPAVAMRTDDQGAALVGEMLRLQDEVAELVHALVVFWEPQGELTPAERQGFADSVAMLASRLQRMQDLEERELFPVCDASVPADDQLDWVQSFAAVEAQRGERSHWARRIEALAARWPAA